MLQVVTRQSSQSFPRLCFAQENCPLKAAFSQRSVDHVASSESGGGGRRRKVGRSFASGVGFAALVDANGALLPDPFGAFAILGKVGSLNELDSTGLLSRFGIGGRRGVGPVGGLGDLSGRRDGRMVVGEGRGEHGRRSIVGERLRVNGLGDGGVGRSSDLFGRDDDDAVDLVRLGGRGRLGSGGRALSEGDGDKVAGESVAASDDGLSGDKGDVGGRRRRRRHRLDDNGRDEGDSHRGRDVAMGDAGERVS